MKSNKISKFVIILIMSGISLFGCNSTEKNKSTNNDKPIAENTINATKNTDENYKKYEGAWFKVEYPADFIVQNSLKSLT